MRASPAGRALLQDGLGFASEVGEVAGLLTRWLRDGELARDRLADELGDVAFYWARLTALTGAAPSALLARSRAHVEWRQAGRPAGGPSPAPLGDHPRGIHRVGRRSGRDRARRPVGRRVTLRRRPRPGRGRRRGRRVSPAARARGRSAARAPGRRAGRRVALLGASVGRDRRRSRRALGAKPFQDREAPRGARRAHGQSKIASGRNAETIQFGASTISLIRRSAATLATT